VKIELTPKDVYLLTDIIEKGCHNTECLDCPLDDTCDHPVCVGYTKNIAEFLLKAGKETNGQ